MLAFLDLPSRYPAKGLGQRVWLGESGIQYDRLTFFSAL